MSAVLFGPTRASSSCRLPFYQFFFIFLVCGTPNIAGRSQELDMGIQGKLVFSFFMSKNHFNFPYIPIGKSLFESLFTIFTNMVMSNFIPQEEKEHIALFLYRDSILPPVLLPFTYSFQVICRQVAICKPPRYFGK